MTRKEYNNQLKEYEQSRKVLYTDTLNLFNANIPVTGPGYRFLEHKYENFYVDYGSTLEQMEEYIVEVKAKVAALKLDDPSAKHFNIELYGEGDYDGAIEGLWYEISYKKMKKPETIDFTLGEHILELAIAEELSIGGVAVPDNLKVAFSNGDITWKALIKYFQ